MLSMTKQQKNATQGSIQKKIKEGVVLISRHVCGFSDHIKEILPQKGGTSLLSCFWLDPCNSVDLALCFNFFVDDTVATATGVAEPEEGLSQWGMCWTYPKSK